MKKLFLFPLLFLTLSLTLCPSPLKANDEKVKKLLEKADELFEMRAYNQAYRAYNQILQKHPKNPYLAKIHYQLARIHLHNRSYWYVLNQLQRYFPQVKELRMKREYQYLMGKAMVLQHYSYPQKILYLTKALQYFEAQKDPREKINDTLFLLAQGYGLNWQYKNNYQGWYKLHGRDKKPALSYNQWNQQKYLEEDEMRRSKIESIYGRIIKDNGSSSDEGARARLELAIFYINHLSNPAGSSGFYPNRQYEFTKAGKDFDQVFRKYVQKGLDLLAKIGQENSTSPLASQAAFLIPYTYHQRLFDYKRALAEYNKFLQGNTYDKYAGNAQKEIQDITSEELSLPSLPILRPGKNPELQMRVRNIPVVQFDVFKLHLEDAMNSHNKRDLQRAAVDYVKSTRPSALHNWKETTGLEGVHTGKIMKVKMPFSDAGAYLVRSRGQKITNYLLVVLSDYGLATVAAKNKLLAYVTDLKTHTPAAGVDVSLKVRGYYNQQNRIFTGQTGADGVAEFPLDEAWRMSRSNYFYHSLVARKGEHHGLIQNSYFYKRNYQRGQYRIYPVTDRPLYKPGDKVYFKVTIRRFEKEKYINFPSESVQIVVQDPRGNKVYDKHMVTSDNGALADEFALPKKATLGMYQIYTYIGGSYSHAFNGQYQFGQFRVEEYKEPEYLVNIDSPKGQIFPGDEVKMKVRAQYYFGGPLRMAKIKYEIYRKAYYWPVQRPSRYENFDGPRASYRYKRRYSPYYRYTPQIKVAAGTGNTNEKGEYELGLKSLKDQGDQQYTIKVEVIDKSRRSIQAQKNITVTKKGFAVKINPSQYLVKIGKKMTVEVQAETASQDPVATTGVVQVYLQAKEKKKIQFVKWDTLKVKTGPNGKGLFSYLPKEEGYYKFVYSTADDRDNRIEGEATAWMVGKDYDGRGYTFNSLGLIPQKKEYESNEEALVLLNSPVPASSALIIISGDQHIFGHKLVQLKGESKLFSIPLQDSYTPNIYLSCLILTEDRQLLKTQTNLKVHPYSSALQVQLISPKGSYSPGQEGVLNLLVTDHQGKGVSTDGCLSVVDTSLFYIQPELVKNIRDHFYNYQRQYQLTFRSSFNFYASNQILWELGFKPRYFRQASLPRLFQYKYYYNFNGFHSNSHLWIKQKEVKKPVDTKNDSPKRQAGLKGGGRDRENNEGSFGAPEEKSADSARVPGAPSAAAPSKSLGRSRGMSKKSRRKDSADNGGSPQGEPEPKFKKATIRKNFANLAYWSAWVKTDDSGKGQIKFKLPDKLTTWKATLRMATKDTKLGEGSASFKTQKLLIIRLQSPRFFTERDQVVLSGVIHNYLKEPKKVKVAIRLKGESLVLHPSEKAKDSYYKETIITLKPKKDYRMDWLVDVKKSGRATIEMEALSETESDAVSMNFPVIRHGIEKFEGQSLTMLGLGGKAAPPETQTVNLLIPKERIVSSTEVRVVLSPSIGAVMLESLPYLASFPYGCVEQTMSRFLPSVLVKRALTDSGLDLTKLPPEGGRVVRGGTFGQEKFEKAKVLSKEVLDDMVEAGLARLYSFQHGDGGWGWWKKDSTNTYMTSYVLYGLIHASKAGVSVDSSVMERGVKCLLGCLLQVDLKSLEPKVERGITFYERQRLAYMAYVVSEYLKLIDNKLQKGEYTALVQELAQHNVALTPYSKALVCLALKNLNLDKEAQTLLEALHKEAVKDEKAGTLTWNKSGYWYYWYTDPVESAAFALRATLAVDPQNKAIPAIVKGLVIQRKGTRWHSTKATATAIFALTEYLKQAGELNPNYKVTLKIDGKAVKTMAITKENLFRENSFVLRGDAVPSGDLKVEIVKEGEGNLYYSVYAKYFSLEEDLTPGGHKLAVKRTYTLIRKENIQEKGRIVEKVTRIPLKSGEGALKSGDIVEVTLEIDSEEPFEYLIFEDHKPAGMEAVRLQSGGGSGVATYMEMRTEKVAIFVSWLPKGKSTLTYQLRAEIPGKFHGMPVKGYCMYSPHVGATSSEFRVEIRDE